MSTVAFLERGLVLTLMVYVGISIIQVLITLMSRSAAGVLIVWRRGTWCRLPSLYNTVFGMKDFVQKLWWTWELRYRGGLLRKRHWKALWDSMQMELGSRCLKSIPEVNLLATLKSLIWSSTPFPWAKRIRTVWRPLTTLNLDHNFAVNILTKKDYKEV